VLLLLTSKAHAAGNIGAATAPAARGAGASVVNAGEGLCREPEG